MKIHILCDNTAKPPFSQKRPMTTLFDLEFNERYVYLLSLFFKAQSGAPVASGVKPHGKLNQWASHWQMVHFNTQLAFR